MQFIISETESTKHLWNIFSLLFNLQQERRSVSTDKIVPQKLHQIKKINLFASKLFIW